MSMSKTGVISRLAGEVFGSAATFGAVKKASAPGQISVADLRTCSRNWVCTTSFALVVTLFARAFKS
ncbi:type I 3-dehydroquinate dehydratase, partial [Salmonella enterica subsp. enterica serovar Kentucky]|nr:type I 3-dehydroquinate dehydratase [Salmonella enterica subsp. enterica serovar Kentucky]